MYYMKINNGENNYYVSLEDKVSTKKITYEEAQKKVETLKSIFPKLDVQIVDEKYVRKGKEK